MLSDKDFSITLHDEILTEIFSRVPAKTLGKFRCLSKTWNSRLTSSHFIKLHLSRNTNQESSILAIKIKSLHIIKPPVFENSRELDLGNGTWKSLLGSCNGIVLLSNQENDMVLVNPTTLEQLKVPFIESTWSGLGFGYDCSSHDYKILTFHWFKSRTGIIEVNLYSVKLGIWRRINHSLHDYFGYGGFINGCLNWFIESGKSDVLFTILVFNLATEVFCEIDVPMSSCGPSPSYGRCTAFAQGGCLCALVPLDIKTDEIWMMKEYGKVNSWTKLGSVADNGEWMMQIPLWIGKSKVMLIAYEPLYNADDDIEVPMIEYNMQDRTWKKMVVNGEVASFREGLSFIDSLVSLREFTSAI